jgi:hypothetical protein
VGTIDWLSAHLADFLNQPSGYYELRDQNDPERLRRHLRKGDVLLVEGDQRVSTVIKLLTQSCWSHVALYVGDELVARGGPLRDEIVDRFGASSEHMLVEALYDGVVASPINKYIDFNLRLCRPHRLRPDDLKRVLDESILSIGWHYDLRNLIHLARHLLMVSLRPGRYPAGSARFGSEAGTEVICSSLLGQVFHAVNFPVLPTITYPDGTGPTPPLGRLQRLLGRDRSRYQGIYQQRHPTLLTPRDFDLSPYFEIVKFNAIADGRFDYQRIAWAVDTDESGPEGSSS